LNIFHVFFTALHTIPQGTAPLWKTTALMSAARSFRLAALLAQGSTRGRCNQSPCVFSLAATCLLRAFLVVTATSAFQNMPKQ
jgi:hypothetical protein